MQPSSAYEPIQNIYEDRFIVSYSSLPRIACQWNNFWDFPDCCPDGKFYSRIVVAIGEGYVILV